MLLLVLSAASVVAFLDSLTYSTEVGYARVSPVIHVNTVGHD